MHSEDPVYAIRQKSGDNRPENRLLGTYRISFGAVLLFTLTMLAVYFVSQEFIASYALAGFKF